MAQGDDRRILFGPLQPALEDALVAEVAALRTRDPVASILLLVGSNLAGLALSRLVARRLGGVAGLRVMTFLDLARSVAESSMLRSGLGLVTPAGESLMARRVASSLDEDDSFKRIAGTAGFEEALLATLGDLEEGGLSPADLRRAGPARHPKTGELAGLYERYAGALRDRRLLTRAGLLRLAVTTLETATADRRRGPAAHVPVIPTDPAALLVYGLYDLTAIQERLLAALAALVPTRVFFPWRDGPAYEFARPTRERLLAIGFEAAEAPPAPGTRSERAIDRVRGRLFQAASLGPGPGGDPSADGTVRIIAAPGEDREALEVARTVAGLAAGGFALEEIAVVHRGGDPYPLLLRTALQRLGVPVFAPGAAGIRSSREARATLLLLEIRGGDFERSKVIEFLTLCEPPAAPGGPASSGAADAAPPGADWDLLSRRAGVVAGRRQWMERLERLGARLEAHARAAALEAHEGRPPDPRLLAEARRLPGVFARLARSVEAIPLEGSWPDLAGPVSAAVRSFLGPTPERDTVLEILDGLESLGAMDQRATLAELRRLLELGLERPTGSEGHFQRGHLFVGDALAARALSFRALVLVGLVEQVFPAPGRPDPILLDEERERLNALVGQRGRLPLKRLRALEERLLFALACESAGEALVLTYPRVDTGTARERLPSPFLLRVVEAIDGRPCDYARLQTFPGLTRVRLGETHPGGGRTPVSEREFDLRAVAEGIERSDPSLALLPAFAGGAARFLLRGLRFEQRRARPVFTEVDGRLTSRAALERLRDRHALAGETLSATRLEDYLTCPYKYFCERVLELRPLDDPEAIDRLSPLERGTLLHAVLQEFFVRLRDVGELPLRSAAREPAARTLLEIFDRRFERLAALGLAGPALSREVERRTLRGDVVRWLDLEMREAEQEGPGGFRPRHFEVRFGMRPAPGGTEPGLPEDPLSRPEPVRLERPPEADVLLKGRIDRIDLSPDGRARVIDYKSGRLERYGGDDPAGGTALQLPVYALAAATLLPGVRVEEALYRSVSRRGRFRDAGLRPGAWDRVLERLREAAALVTRGVADGLFFHHPDEAAQCLRCDSRPVCGERRVARYVRKRDDPAAAPFRSFAEADHET